MKWFLVPLLVLISQPAMGNSMTSDPPDMAAYFDEIRATGVTEMGASHLSSVAGIRLGETIFQFFFDEDSGCYGRSYSSTSCGLPGEDPEERRLRLAEIWRKRKVAISSLLPFVDADGSGFVTTDEARVFRDLVEFGYLAAMLSAEDPVSVEELATAACEEIEQATIKLETYLETNQRVEAAGLEPFPAIAVEADAR